MIRKPHSLLILKLKEEDKLSYNKIKQSIFMYVVESRSFTSFFSECLLLRQKYLCFWFPECALKDESSNDG